jgi:NADH-quinone oxidoreductase subunit L
MIAALGVGSYVGAVFHLVTHAFFKALLFLGSGSVIHGMEHGALFTGEHVDVQDMWNMGGLRSKMPVTFLTFLAGGLSLAGFPLITAGFWSKDEILNGAFSGGFLLVFIVLAITALITAFYTARQITLTFLGKARSEAAIHAHESSKSMVYPLALLAFFAICAGWLGIPAGFPILGGHEAGWFQTFLAPMNPLEGHSVESHSLVPLLVSLIVSLGGLVLGWQVYKNMKAGQVDPVKKTLGPVFTLLQNKYYIDEIYSAVFIKPAVWVAEQFTAVWMDKQVIDGIIHAVGKVTPMFGSILRNSFDKPVISNGGDAFGNGINTFGKTLRKVQTGRVQQYMIMTIWIMLISGMAAYYFLGAG